MTKGAMYFPASCDKNTLPAQVNEVLINMVTNCCDEKAIKETQLLIQSAGTKTIFLDSSGFSLLCNEEKALKDLNYKKSISSNKYRPILYKNEAKEEVMNITPEHIISSAMKIPSHIVATLDSPLRANISKDSMELEFKNKLPFNMKMARRTYELKQKYCPNVKLYLPLQIYSIADFFQYIEGVKDLSFDGYAIPYRNMDIIDLVEIMYQTYLLDIRNFHVFGTAEFAVIAVSSYVGRHLFNLISWDSCTWRISAQNSQYVNPYDLSKDYIGDNSKILVNNSICSCPWCKFYSFDDIKAMSKASRDDFLRCHNYHATKMLALELYENSSSLTQLMKLIRFNNPKGAQSIINALQRADYLIQKGKKPLKSIPSYT